MKKDNFLRKLSEVINPIKEDYGNITIKKNKKKIWVKTVFKLFGIVFISSMLGAFLSVYIITSKYVDIIFDKINPNINSSKVVNEGTNSISNVVKVVAPSIVTVGNDESKLSIGLESEDNISGIIIRSDGYILTSNSAINKFEDIYVKLPSNGSKPFKAHVIGSDQTSDIAIIKIESHDLPKVKFSDDDKIEVGDKVIAVGNSISDDYVGMVTSGIVTSLNKKIRLNIDQQTEGVVYNVIETDTIINSENNSGILCNLKGEVVGVNSLYLTNNHSKNTLNYALSGQDVEKIIDSILSYKDVAKVSLGIDGVTLVAGSSSNLEGVYIESVIKDGSAYKANLRPTDIIVELDGESIKKVEDIVDILDKHVPGDIINCKVIRGDSIKECTVTLQEKK